MIAPCLALGAAQLGVTARFFLKLRKEGTSPLPRNGPRVTVLVPCCGESEHFDRNVAALLEQDYPGEADYLFVTPSESDPAYARLRSSLADRPARARLLASGQRPSRCSGKAVDLLFALKHVAPDAEVLVFADSDLRVHRRWLASLVGPFEDPAVGATTSLMLYIPEARTLPSLLRMAWMGGGLPYLELMGVVSGQSFAMRKADFEALGVADIWGRSLLEDLALYPTLRRWKKRTVFVGRAMSFSPEAAAWSGLMQVFNRWILGFKVYAAPVWLQGLLVTALKAYVLWWCLRPPVSWLPLAVLLGMDAANLLLLFLLYRGVLTEGFGEGAPSMRGIPALAALVSPLLQPVYALNFLNSLVARDVRWGRYLYRLDGSRKLSATPRA